ncbi:GapA-binding peptide SR1P [Bacillus sp. V3B]|nr:GapA-binding peptide SR1P [Bacillus sp. V3B]MCQ6275114.1 GapA-binding peptide SR1P [Bacillus sp. V3B]
MGTIVCQECNATLDHFEDEKVTVLYSSNCNCCKHEKIDQK